MLRRLGFPDARHHKALVTGIGIDALGSGVFMPVSILYFLMTTEVGKARVGLAVSLAALFAVPFVLVAGTLVDKVGPKRIILAGNLVQAIGFVGYLRAETFWQIVAVQSVVSLGQSAFWSAFSPLVAASTPAGQREVWFGFLGALRNVGFAVGGLATGVAVSIGTDTAYHALVVVNASTYLLAFLILTQVRGGQAAPAAVQDADSAAVGGWSVLLRDRRYLALVGTNASYALCTLSLNVVMPVYAVDVLGLPGWIGGGLFVVNTVIVGLGQGLVVRRMHGHRRHRIITAGLGMYVAGFVALGLSGTLPASLATIGILISVAIYTVGEVLANPPLAAAAVEAAPPAYRGRYLSAFQLSWVSAGIIAPALYLALLERDRFSVWVVLIVIAVAGISVLRVLAPRLPAAHARVTSAASAKARTTGGQPVAAQALAGVG